MEIQIGELLFLGGNSPYQLSPSIQGLDSPAIRIGDGLYAGRDGGFVSGHFYGHRTLTIKGFYIANSCESFSNLRKLLMGLLRIRYSLPIKITMPGGTIYYTEGYVQDVKAEIGNIKSGEFQITLLCPDPLLYAYENNSVVWEELPLTINDVTSVPNGGDIEIYPIITIEGIIDGIEITNDTNEMTMQVDITTQNANDKVIIDMEKRIITLNGEAMNEYRTALSRWWPLEIENNSIIVYADNATADVTIKYREGYTGI